MPVSLAPGRHTLSSATTGPVKFIVYTNGKGGLINPTLTQYVVVNEIYTVNEAARSGFAPLKSEIEVDGVKVRGPFTTSRQLFIDQTWRFGVHEPFPATIQATSNAKGNIQGKIFTADEFVRYYGGPEFAEHERIKTPPEKPSTKLPVIADFTDPEMQAASADLREAYAGFPKADTADAQKAIADKYTSGVHKLLAVYSVKAMNIGPVEAQKYNDLVQGVGELMGRSALVVD